MGDVPARGIMRTVGRLYGDAGGCSRYNPARPSRVRNPKRRQELGTSIDANRPIRQEVRLAEPGESSDSAPEAELIERCREGDRAAFGGLIARYQERIYNLCLRLSGDPQDAADLTQEAFVKALTSIQRFDQRAAFYTWLYRIAVNVVLDHRRRRKTQGGLFRGGDTAAVVEQVAAPRARHDPIEQAAVSERRAAVSAALMRLDEVQRAIVVLRDIEQLDYTEIAAVLEIPLGTVKSRLFRARLALKEILGPALGESAEP